MCHGACHIITYSPVLNHHLFCALFPTNLFLLLVRISWQDVPRMLSSSSLDLRHISFRSQLKHYFLREFPPQPPSYMVSTSFFFSF